MGIRLDPSLVLGMAFAFGAVVGSFANVCIYRIPRKRENQEELGLQDEEILPEGHTIVQPRSFCPGCRRPIAWFDNVPLLSYALLNGRCRGCKTRIPFRYPFVEFLTGALFALSAWRFQQDLAMALVAMGVSAALVVLTFIDLDFRIIPDGISLGGTAVAFGLSALMPSLHLGVWPVLAGPVSSRAQALLSAAVGAAVGAGSIYAMHLLGLLYLRGKARLRGLPWDRTQEVVGGGDLKLMAAVGALMGWQGAVLVFFIAPVFGAAAGGVRMLVSRDPYIAYGPFLALAAFLVLLWRGEILDWFAAGLARGPAA